MTNKLYEKTKHFIKENYRFFFILMILIIICLLPMPFYIHAPGGLVNITDRVKVENGYQSNGSLNLAYVSEYKGTIPLYLLSLLQKDWDIVAIEEIVETNETVKDSELRSQLMLIEANQAAVINAFTYALKKVTVKEEHYLVSYVDPDSPNQLQIGDELISINHKSFLTKDQMYRYIKECEVGQKLTLEIIRDEKKMELPVTIYLSDGIPKIGVVITSKKVLETDPKVTFEFKDSESGPSGGMMMSLAIYNAITKSDITKGFKIAGTGTIDEQGNIGTIGGIEYKIMGAEKEHADLFFVPSGQNYEDALKLKKKRNYKIKIIEVKTFQDVLNYLEKQ